MVKLIVMIPAFNEEGVIANVIRNIPRNVSSIKSVEVLVMDDKSTDNTVKVSKNAGADYVITNEVNQGLGQNFKKGINHALRLGADIIVNIDADGQFNSKDIPKLIQPILNKEADVVTCSRFIDPSIVKNMPFRRKIGNLLFANIINRITGRSLTDVSCGFRAYSREAALRLNLFGSFTYTHESIIDLTNKNMRISEIALPVVYFEERRSLISGNLISYGVRSLNIMIRATRDTQPLSFFGRPALLLLFIGLIGIAFSFGYWLIYHATTPVRFLFQVSVFLAVFGISLGILALLADMLKTIKMNQEEMIYRMKKGEYGG
ncbi:glycosyltransferase family 2 protein [Candidatus Woesearchaeota archaeon]|nr:glycosyltransferase family 2 protein [Candidatus Woesearchaeota archaeon]